jgi:cysteine sulfinate desulfinase/cysteine desulfurase-like protein
MILGRYMQGFFGDIIVTVLEDKSILNKWQAPFSVHWLNVQKKASMVLLSVPC